MRMVHSVPLAPSLFFGKGVDDGMKPKATFVRDRSLGVDTSQRKIWPRVSFADMKERG